uniref:Uncharacterized protein n=1 Tax=Leersia perrieri TaxID=77586 RepID=A0A0D9W5X1_9ORYZ
MRRRGVHGGDGGDGTGAGAARATTLAPSTAAGSVRTSTFRAMCLDKAAIVDTDVAKQPVTAIMTVTEVEEVKMVVKLLPIWSTRPTWTAAPAGSFSAFLFLSILLFTVLNERLLAPLARRLGLTRRPQGQLTSLQRVGAGLALATLAMAVSALVERKRRRAVDISAFWLAPQFFLVGAGEAFAYVGQLEFFVREAPERMKSMSTGLFLSTVAMGFFASSVLVAAVDAATRGAWIPDGLDGGRLDLFYWTLAVLGVANFAVFLVFASRHQYRPAASADDVELREAGSLTEEDAVREAAATAKVMDV